MLADLTIGDRIIRKADGGRRPKVIQEIPGNGSALVKSIRVGILHQRESDVKSTIVVHVPIGVSESVRILDCELEALGQAQVVG